MGPSRKKARTKPPQTKDSTAGNTSGEPPVEESSSTAAKPSTLTPDTPYAPVNTSEDAVPHLQKPRPESSSGKLLNKASWYGTWPRKSIASTQVARESILADKPTGTPGVDLSRFEQPKKSPITPTISRPSRPPSMYLGKSKETLDVTMSGTSDVVSVADKPERNTTESTRRKTISGKTGETQGKAEEGQGTPDIVSDTKSPPKAEIPPARPVTSSGWLGGWLGRTNEEVLAAPGDNDPQTAAVRDKPDVKEQVVEPEVSKAVGPVEEAPGPDTAATATATASASWFGLWSTAAPSTATEAPQEELPVKVTKAASREGAKDGEDTVMKDVPTVVPEPDAAKEPSVPTAGSSWAFWSTEPQKIDAQPLDKPKDAGELAVAGETSQNKPEPAKSATVKDDRKPKKSKRDRPQSTELDGAVASTVSADPSVTPSQIATGKKSPPNLLVPSVKSTYRLMENPSILQQITRLLLHNQQAPVKHVFLTKEHPKIKTALAIGIHGLFPAPLLRTVIGQPTGTSIRFANHAAEAIRRWTDKNGSVNCEIEKVALEGEGKIADRVDNLWKLLLNWIDHVRKADFVLIACHSQGVPVALMLVAKLIEFGVVTSGRIGVCAMAGVSLGPFADYKSRLFSGSAGELFDFANPESAVSKRYEDALKIAVKYGVRVTYCGSIDDQLISLESSIFSTVSHPYIFRAVFVDGRIHAPDFLSHLVGFALKLRNLGVSDHGLIRELSAPLAGSLYTGEGHSRLYDDGNVYDLAVEFALETTSVGDVPLDIKKYEIPTNANPYVLPWIMRGLLEEDFVKTELDQETTQLLTQFDDWKPATKVLKDVKYRLEAVRSKL